MQIYRGGNIPDRGNNLKARVHGMFKKWQTPAWLQRGGIGEKKGGRA